MDDIVPGAGAGAPAASPAAPGPGESAAPPAAGGAAPSPGAPAAQPVELLRREYETTKQDRDEWAKLGKRDEVQRSHQTYQKLFTEVTALGQQLGYEAAELQQAFQTDPAGTLAFLRQTAQQTSGSDKPLTQVELQKLIDRQVSDKLKPFHQEREQALDTKAESAFDGEFDRQFKTSFPNGLPDSAKEALSGLAWSLLIENKDGYGALRTKGDAAAVAGAFTQAKTTLLKILSDYGEHEKKRVGGAPPENPGGGAAKKPQTLDDMINRIGNRTIPDSEIFTR